MIKRILRDYNRERKYEALLNEYKVEDPLHDSSQDLRQYIAVRVDILPPLNQGIQAAHAAVAYAAHFGHLASWTDWATVHQTMIVIGVENALDMERLRHRAMKKSYKYVKFSEPDLGTMTTAIAFEPMRITHGKDIFFGFRSAR